MQQGSVWRGRILRMVSLVFGLTLILAQGAVAAPVRYLLDEAASAVGFTYYLDAAGTKGQMPVKTAELMLDLRNVSRSKIDVTLNPKGARAGFFIATEALKGAQVLDVQNHPEIRFVARRITGSIHKAEVQGDLTVRGVSRPVTLQAQLFRQAGTQEDDLSKLSVLLTGSLDRREFGATGYADLVAPKIDLRILARVDRAS